MNWNEDTAATAFGLFLFIIYLFCKRNIFKQLHHFSAGPCKQNRSPWGKNIVRARKNVY